MVRKIEIDEQDFAANSRARQISESLAQKRSEKIHDANDPDSIKRQQEKSLKVHADLSSALLTLISTEAGRAWVNDLFKFCDVLGNPHVPGNPDHTSFNLGMQNVGKKVLTQILELAPEQYPVILREAIRRDNE